MGAKVAKNNWQEQSWREAYESLLCPYFLLLSQWEGSNTQHPS